MHINPFLTSGYISEVYFCDRVKETDDLIQSVQNNNNVTLVAPRRMGKTGLILHTFEKIKKSKKCSTLYIDIFATRSIAEFIKVLSESIIKEYPEKTTIGRKFWDFIKNMRPLISYDPISGVPQVQINYQSEGEKQQTLHNVLHFLEQQNRKIIIAIDEFQQIREYPEENTEAFLRGEIQHLKNITFIFCGSKRHMMLDIFSNNKNPFYASTRFLFLTEIAQEEYAKFIHRIFTEGDFEIEKETIDLILYLTRCYTYYTQALCNKIYGYQIKKSTPDTVKKAFQEILDQQTPVYLQLRELLTTAQWNYLIAIAKEESISQITAQRFLMEHQIGTASNSTRLMKSLIEKELILETIGTYQKEYRIYDLFLAHWLKNKY